MIYTTALVCPVDLVASFPEVCRQCDIENWSQICSGQRGGRVLQVHTQRLETDSDIGDMLQAIFRSQKNAFKINLSFGFILSNVETGYEAGHPLFKSPPSQRARSNSTLASWTRMKKFPVSHSTSTFLNQ